jgi:hypothetical protein
MKKISHAIVMVEDIHPSLPRSEFSETDLNEAAQLILKMGGIITPPILLQTGIDSYTIVDGTFEYYAALKAEEIEPLRGETINAYVIESEQEKTAYEKQIKLFRHRSTAPEQILPLPPEPEPEIMPSEDDHLIAIEKTLNQLLAKNDALVSEQKVRDHVLHDAVETIKHVGEKMDHFGAEIKQAFGEQIKVLGDQMKGLQAPEEPVPPGTPTSMEEKFLKELNELPALELALKLESALEIVSIMKNKEKVISRIENERKKWPFASVDDLKKRVKGTGFGEQKIKSLINKWY